MKKQIFFILISINSYSQNIQNTQSSDSLANIVNLDEVTVNSVRARDNSPLPFVNISKKDLEKTNLAQDIPTLLKNTPSVITTSFPGAGIGYSSIRVRGSDPSRVNVTINGVPYNDSESMGVYWVNLPDFASSIESIQIQRGVGTSTNGSAAFGGSLNIQTNAASDIASFEINNTLGSFSTIKNSVGFSTGFINDKFELSGRLSRIKSGGYIDRSGSKLRSYFLQGVYKDSNTLLKLLNFAGHELTDQAWFGIDASNLESNRKYNPAGEYYDKNGNIQYYNNQDEDYKQDHYQIHWNQSYENGWISNFGLHYTYGRGYYESYNVAFDTNSSDNIDRRWLDNNFYGLIFSLNDKSDNYNAIVGGSYNKYEGQHFGEYLWYADSNKFNNYKEKFYDDYGNKSEFNFYAKLDYYLSQKLLIYGDLQYRNINYNASITPYSVILGYVEEGYDKIDKKFNFFNPKIGLFYNKNEDNQLYISYARAQREPTRADYANGSPNPEKLDDFELGWRRTFSSFSINLNAFYMLYDDQLVLTGERDINGYEIRTNVGESYRLGLEVDSKLYINSNLNIESNFSISENKNKNLFFSFDGELRNYGNTDIAYSPNFIANNIINISPSDKTLVSLRSNYVSEQFFAQINSPISKLDSFFINDINVVHEVLMPNYADELKIKLLINNIFDVKYTSYGGYYTYELPEGNSLKTYEGTYYYPQSGINFLLGIDIKF